MKSKRQELLELNYEHIRGWLFPILAVIVSLIIAVSNMSDGQNKTILSLLLLSSALVYLTLFIIYNIIYNQLKKYILAKKE